MSSFWIARYTPGAFGRLYTLSEQDLSVIKRRGDANRLGFAVLLCCLRYPEYALSAGEDPPHTFFDDDLSSTWSCVGGRIKTSQ